MSEQLLGNERVIRKLVSEGDPLVDRVISWAENVKKTLSGKGEKFTLAEKRRMDKALKLYLKAAEASGKTRLANRIRAILKEEEKDDIEPLADKNGSYDNENGVSNNVRTTNANNVSVSNIKFALKIGNSLSENVDSVLLMRDEEAKKNKTEGNFVSVMQNTPAVVLNNVKDAENLEIIMRFDSFYLATRRSGVLEGHYHNYGQIMKRLPAIISDPIAIVRMDNDRLNLLSAVETSKGKYSIVSVELNTIKDINSQYEKYNMVISVIPSKDNYMKNNLNNHAVKVEYIKEDLPQVNHQLYEWLAIVNERSSSSSIPDSTEKVKSETKFSYKAPADSAVYKRIAEWEKLKVYEKADAEKMLYTIMTDVMTFSEDQAAVMTLEDRKDAEQLLWAELNKKAERENRSAFNFLFQI